MSIEGTGASLLAPPRCKLACTSPYSFYVLEFWMGSVAESRPAAGRPHRSGGEHSLELAL